MVNAENISTLDALAITLIMKTTFAPFYRFKWKEILVRFGKYVNVAAHSIRMFHFVKFPVLCQYISTPSPTCSIFQMTNLFQTNIDMDRVKILLVEYERNKQDETMKYYAFFHFY